VKSGNVNSSLHLQGHPLLSKHLGKFNMIGTLDEVCMNGYGLEAGRKCWEVDNLHIAVEYNATEYEMNYGTGTYEHD